MGIRHGPTDFREYIPSPQEVPQELHYNRQVVEFSLTEI